VEKKGKKRKKRIEGDQEREQRKARAWLFTSSSSSLDFGVPRKSFCKVVVVSPPSLAWFPYFGV